MIYTGSDDMKAAHELAGRIKREINKRCDTQDMYKWYDMHIQLGDQQEIGAGPAPLKGWNTADTVIDKGRVHLRSHGYIPPSHFQTCFALQPCVPVSAQTPAAKNEAGFEGLVMLLVCCCEERGAVL
eukprot:285846-Pelagomonas_calceolata.AAC.3